MNPSTLFRPLVSTILSLLTLVRAAIMLASVVVIMGTVLALIVFVTFDHEAAEYTSGGEPIQFYRDLDPDLLDDYRGVFAVAHNSGNLVGTTEEALRHGADVIEIDVMSVSGKLRAAHRSPVPILGTHFFRGPSLEEVWEAAAAADVIKLDLKKSTPEYLEALFDFLSGRIEEQEIVISTRDPQTLQAVRERAPRVIRILSIGDQNGFERLRGDEELQALIDGVTIRHTVLNEERAAWLRERGLIIFAWTVNDLRRVNELVVWGVQAINTDNLAIMELLGGQDRGEATLRSLISR